MVPCVVFAIKQVFMKIQIVHSKPSEDHPCACLKGQKKTCVLLLFSYFFCHYSNVALGISVTNIISKPTEQSDSVFTTGLLYDMDRCSNLFACLYICNSSTNVLSRIENFFMLFLL